jgi:hypothetical protein
MSEDLGKYLTVSKAPPSAFWRISAIGFPRRTHCFPKSAHIPFHPSKQENKTYLSPSKDEGNGVFDILITYNQLIDACVRRGMRGGESGEVIMVEL